MYVDDEGNFIKCWDCGESFKIQSYPDGKQNYGNICSQCFMKNSPNKEGISKKKGLLKFSQ
jgi:hypothetical protein